MTDTAIVGDHVEVLQTSEITAAPAALSWAAIIAGALAATAITLILLALGAGIGFLSASPYSDAGPSAAALTALAAIWIVLSQTWGYACGGYLAARIRRATPAPSANENNFRDGAHGFVVWALGVVLMTVLLSLGATFATGTTAQVGAALAPALGSQASQNRTEGFDASTYFADVLLRLPPRAAAPAGQPTDQPAQGAVPQQAPPLAAGQSNAPHAEIGRIFAASLAYGQLADADRDHLVGVVMARTGLPEADARQRVTDTETRLRETAREAGDKAAKAAAYFSFWTFMSLLMGAAAATVGGIFGGNQRDEEMSAAGTLSPR